MATDVILFGAGGHAKVLLEALQLSGNTVIGVIDADTRRLGESLSGVPIIGTDRDVFRLFAPEEIQLVNGVGAAVSLEPRHRLFSSFRDQGFHFLQVRHPSAIVSPSSSIGEGAHLLAGSVTGFGVSLGDNVILNTGCVVDHDCLIGDHCHIAPGAIICGGVTLGEGVFVGAGATVIQGIHVGDRAFVAAGSTVVRDIPPGCRVMGVPAREVRR